MFLQVIQGRVPDRAAMRAQHERWLADIGSGTPGWLGSTAGITEDDRFICLSRFASVEALAKLSARSDHREWWARTERLFLGPVVTTEFADAVLMIEGGSDDAGFVQVIQGRTTDPWRLRSLEKELLRYLPEGRQDIIGGLAAVGPDGRFVRVFYFSSEELARAGEHGEQLPEIEEVLFDMRELTGEPTYHDLRHPWLVSPPLARAGRSAAEATTEPRDTRRAAGHRR
ncbi:MULTISPECIES: hypothetical protein [unclassified Pseudofrankia]|uniref:hypothetical protein n=1 Tax=unclassified Pseudofrankia TaxID=2994372 RepID=UPI0009F6B66D|nr:MULTISPECIES: hypothetical protein [unclassified Pseudofrankia]MDT3443748.1 hypothetical protein [Pseudofrankia sp. BMG5.37]